MSENIDIKALYPIDENRLSEYYLRVKKRYSENNQFEIGARFLISQSIGTDKLEIIPILEYFEKNNPFGSKIIDFIIEWIRAQSIRLEYKKYLIRADYPEDSKDLAIDDCISRFFVKYDKYVRNLVNSNTSDYILATLYFIFFFDYRSELNFTQIVADFKKEIPPKLFDDISINTYTLRLSLSKIIAKDYKGVVVSRKMEVNQRMETQNTIKATNKANIRDLEFKCSLLEKTIKTYFIKKEKVDPKAINNATTQLLNSFFRSGELYEFLDFFQILIDALTDTIYDSLIDEFKELYHKNRLRKLIRDVLVSAKDIEEIEVLDGIAWINDLTPIINNLIAIIFERVINYDILNNREMLVCEEEIPKISIEQIKRKIKQLEDLNLADLCILEYSVDQFRTLLEETLNETDIGLINKRNYIREKMQAFKSELRNR
ncbi:MAG: hypothetical protein EU547_04475 [Promethearchaeota archaeon]|nr:MAG: hypothetical protein EU547_04475 [Candidatus Lokiarchaeota archaeon]